MGCDKIRLRETIILECPLCDERVDQCDDCGDFSVINDDWYCYSDGDEHYCETCWQKEKGE